MKKIQINYLDSDEKTILASHKTDDAWTAEERANWDAWLNDPAVEQYGAPEKWSCFELVPYVAE
jgi:hypothetical protein